MSAWLVQVGPDLAVAMLTLGGLLICFEFNRPGTVLPVSTGLLLLLLAAYRLAHFPLRAGAIALVLFSLAALAVDVKLQLKGIAAVMGSILLIFSLRYLVVAPSVQTGTAVLAGGIFGATVVVLGKIGERARRAKLLPKLRAE